MGQRICALRPAAAAAVAQPPRTWTNAASVPSDTHVHWQSHAHTVRIALSTALRSLAAALCLCLPSPFPFPSLSADASIRAQVEAYLKNEETTNFASYIHQLVVELGTAERPLEVRLLAGLTLKNTVDARSEQAVTLLHQRWKALPDQQRAAVKGMLLQILQDADKKVRNTAALVSSQQKQPQKTLAHLWSVPCFFFSSFLPFPTFFVSDCV